VFSRGRLVHPQTHSRSVPTLCLPHDELFRLLPFPSPQTKVGARERSLSSVAYLNVHPYHDIFILVPPEDPDKWVSSGREHASLKSFFLRCLPNLSGTGDRSWMWNAFMWFLEIPPYLENNIARYVPTLGSPISRVSWAEHGLYCDLCRKLKKLMAKKRLPRPNEMPGIASQYFFQPYVPSAKWLPEYIKDKVWLPRPSYHPSGHVSTSEVSDVAVCV
jgi:hypothetical protein